jgi:hypothetical protein
MKGPRPTDPGRRQTRTPAPTQKDQESPPKTNKKKPTRPTLIIIIPIKDFNNVRSNW